MAINVLMPLIVVLPLLSSPIIVMFNNRRAGWLISLAVIIFSLASSVILFTHIQGSGSANISYYMGGWKAPIGIEYQLNPLNGFFLILILVVSAITTLYALPSVAKEIPEQKQASFYAVFMLCLTGLLGMTITNDFFNAYVFLEIASLSMYALVALGGNRKSLMASFEYLILGSAGATFFLIGIGMVYMMTGSLNMSDIAERIKPVSNTTTIKAGFAFTMVGLMLKTAVFPLYAWAINVYTNSPSFITSFLSGTSSKVGLYLMVKLIYLMFGWGFVFNNLPFSLILTVLAVFGIAIGSLGAIFQVNLKSIFAYSSIVQIAYILIAIGLSSDSGLVAAALHCFSHSISKVGVFISIGAIMLYSGRSSLHDLKGLAKDMPVIFTTLLIGCLSLIGIPGTAGFISKWYLIKAVAEQKQWILLSVLCLSFLLTIVYIFRMLYYSILPAETAVRARVPVMAILPALIFAAINVISGFYTDLTYVPATHIAKFILE